MEEEHSTGISQKNKLGNLKSSKMTYKSRLNILDKQETKHKVSLPSIGKADQKEQLINSTTIQDKNDSFKTWKNSKAKTLEILTQNIELLKSKNRPIGFLNEYDTCFM